MRYFDLHCDTITECWRQKLPLRENSLQVDLTRGNGLEDYVQCYAVWIPDNLCGVQAFQRFSQVAAHFAYEIDQNRDILRSCTDFGNFFQMGPGKPRGAFLTVENASALGGRLENIAELARLGVKLCTLTWNGENELGRGVRALGSIGLTAFGKQAVAEFEQNGIVVDISHASPELFWDVIDIARRPVVATHSNAKALCGHPRNLTDEQFQAVRDSGGLVGSNFIRYFLTDHESQAVPEDVLRHADHFLNLGGEDVLAIGADWDGGAPDDFALPGLQGIPELYELFLRHGFGTELTDKIFYQNAADFFQRENLL